MENIIHRGKHLCPASEVFVQVDPLLLAVFQRIAVVFFHKKLRSRQTKTIDALLDISYHKDIFALLYPSGHHRCDKFLHKVTVLILVHHDFLVFLRQFSCCLCRDQFSIHFLHKDPEGKMLHICEIQKILLSLLSGKSLLKLQGQFCQSFQRHSCTGDQLQKDFLFLIKKLRRKILADFFFLISEFFCLFFFDRIYGAVSFGRKFRKRMSGQDIRNLIIIFGFPASTYFPPEIQVINKCFVIKIRAVRLIADFSCTLCQCLCLIQFFIQRFPKELYPACFTEFFDRLHAVDFHAFFQPFFRVRMAHCRLVEFVYHITDLIIGFPRCITFYQTQKLRISLFVCFFEKVFHDIFLQKFQLTLLRCPISRIKFHHVKIVPDDIRTETIDRCDLCVMDQCCLSLEMFIVRVFVQCLIDRIGDSLLHLARCCPGKRHDQKPVNIHRSVGVHDLAQDPLNQHGCLTGTRCCTDQNIAVPQGDDFALFFSPFHSHITLPPVQNSSRLLHRQTVSVSGIHSPGSCGQSRSFPDMHSTCRHFCSPSHTGKHLLFL